VHDHCPRSKAQRSRSQSYTKYQQQKTLYLGKDSRIKLGAGQGGLKPPPEVWEGTHSPGVGDQNGAILPFPIPVCTAKQRLAGIAAVNTDLSVSNFLHAVKPSLLTSRSQHLPQQKNSRILTNFPKLKNRKHSYKNSLNARVGVAFQWNSLFLCYKI